MKANNGESVYGVTELIKPGVKGRKGYNNKMSYSIPEGGTGYATARGILLNKPTYVFNQSDKSINVFSSAVKYSMFLNFKVNLKSILNYL